MDKVKIIVYGLGKAFFANKKFIESEFAIIGYSDKKKVDLDMYIEPCDISKYIYDYVVITSEKFFAEMKEELLKNKYVNKAEKIVLLKEYLQNAYNERLNDVGGSGLTDTGQYPELCFMASRDEKIFSNFRCNPIYNTVLEHVSEELGEKYLQIIGENETYKFSDFQWDYFQQNDLFGNPRRYKYIINSKEREISPTTIRYAKVLQDIETLFDTRQVKRIAEIGVGYGGQCRIFLSGGVYEHYTLVDLPEVLELVKKYLGSFRGNNNCTISYVDGTKQFASLESDLVISNYAFSELRRDVQDIYIEKIILKSPRGYITWNAESYQKLDGYSVEELLNIIPRARVMEERPLSAEKNCIIVWGAEYPEETGRKGGNPIIN